jgi:hypothetical protein
MPEKSHKLGHAKVEAIVKNLLKTPHTKRKDAKPDEKKPEKLIPPQKQRFPNPARWLPV